MKKVLYPIIAAFIFLFACQKEELVPVNETSHQVIYTSEMDFDNKIQVHGKISFGDVSSGVVSRTWTFPAGVVDIVDTDNDVTSTEATVTAFFNEVGQFDVHLSQTFSDDAYVGNTQVGKELDTVIVVTVLDTIRPAIQAHYLNDDGTLGAELNIADGAANEVPAAEKIRVTYSGVGGPDVLTWNVEGGSPPFISGEQLSVDIEYKFLGTYDLELIASRARPFGRDTLSYEDFITVIPSSEPVVVERVTDRDGNIAVVFNRALDGATIEPSEFDVSIENDGEVITTNIASIELDVVEPNTLIINLAGESIYNDDIIKVSYAAGGLISADLVPADSFTEEILVFNKVNILEQFSSFDYSFENGSVENWLYQEWGHPWDRYEITYSNAMAYEGEQSLYVDWFDNGGMIIKHVALNGDSIAYPALAGKAYELGAWS